VDEDPVLDGDGRIASRDLRHDGVRPGDGEGVGAWEREEDRKEDERAHVTPP
jgi:hypothetical protein